MKLFFYKSILVFFLFIIAIHFSFGLIKNELKREFTKISSKENIEQIKEKIREEIRDGLDKDRYLNPVVNENRARSHVLFPDYESLLTLNQELITSGSDFKADIEFGQLADPIDNGTYNEVLAVDFGDKPGTQIDGPIAKIKIITGGAIAYKTFQ